MKRTKKKTEIVIPGMREQDWEKDLKNLDHYHAEGMKERPPVWRCYLCKRLEGEESLGIDFDKHLRAEGTGGTLVLDVKIGLGLLEVNR